MDATYRQSDRDLELKTNTSIREELASRTRAIDSLREIAMGLMDFIDQEQSALVDDNLESLFTLMGNWSSNGRKARKTCRPHWPRSAATCGKNC